jgi:hypothetical protein
MYPIWKALAYHAIYKKRQYVLRNAGVKYESAEIQQV